MYTYIKHSWPQIHYVAQTGLQLMVLLPHPLWCWYCRHILLYLVESTLRSSHLGKGGKNVPFLHQVRGYVKSESNSIRFRGEMSATVVLLERVSALQHCIAQKLCLRFTLCPLWNMASLQLPLLHMPRDAWSSVMCNLPSVGQKASGV